MMDAAFYFAISTILVIFIIILTLLKKSRDQATFDFDDDEEEAPRPVRAAMAGGMRRRVPRRRMVAGPRAVDEADSGEEEELDDSIIDPTGEGKKIGAKKMRKLQEKAEKKAQREAMEQERKDRQRREALLEQQRKKDEEKQKLEDAAKEEELKAIREEQERKEHEEYLKLKEMFSVDEEGTHEEELNQDTASLLEEFINYIKDMKVVMLEDLASHFKIKTQDTIDRINTLTEEGRLTGVMDDRGKFIYITREEYEAVTKFIKQRGRVSITELAESSNKLINLNPENKEVHRKLVGEVA